MKVLVLFGLIAATLAAPLPDADADADAANVVVAHHAGLAPLAYAGAHVAHTGVAPVSYAHHGAIAPVSYAHHGAIAPVSYAHHGAIAPVSYAHHGAIAPVSYAAAPAVAHAVAPVSYATVAQQVALPPAQVKVPVTTHHVEVPVHQKVHYGTQAYVSGATTTIHKPSLAAPAIAPPSTLLAKVTHHAPEVTLKRQEIPVERHTPNFVDTPYHAGTVIQYTAPEVREVKVPTPVAQPVAVPHPVPVAAPYTVPQPFAVPGPQVHSVNVHHPLNYVQYAAAPTLVKAD